MSNEGNWTPPVPTSRETAIETLLALFEGPEMSDATREDVMARNIQKAAVTLVVDSIIRAATYRSDNSGGLK